MVAKNRSQEFVALFLIVGGAVLRVLPHPDNFTPVTAIALLAGAALPARLALTVPLGIMIASDIVIGPHGLFWVTWGAFLLVSLVGVGIRKNLKPMSVFFGALAGSVVFFAVSNFGVFLEGQLYPRTWAGFVDCFVMAIPFYRNQILGDLFYTAVFFGIFAAARSAAKRATSST